MLALEMSPTNTYARSALYNFAKRNNVVLPVRKASSSRGGKNRTLAEILVNDETKACSANLKNRLITAGILKEECSICKSGPIKNEKYLSLQLDHINGVKTDNREENLRLLCPDCHSQTDTYSYGSILDDEGNLRYCRRCNEPCRPENKECGACIKYLIRKEGISVSNLPYAYKKYSLPSYRSYVSWVEDDVILELLKKNSIRKTAATLEVSVSSLSRYIPTRPLLAKHMEEKRPKIIDGKVLEELLEEYTQKEVAEILGVSRSVISRRISSIAQNTNRIRSTKIQWGTRKELEALITSHNGNMEAVARELGVSSNAVRKRLRNHPEDVKDDLTV